MTAVRAHVAARDDGTVSVRLGELRAPIGEALADAVGTRVPAGSSGTNPCVYCIHATLVAVHAEAAGQRETVLAEDNATRLIRRGDYVDARSLYEMWDDEGMPVRDLVGVLNQWRHQVLPLYTAPDGSFEIEPRWREEVVYWEGAVGYVLDAGWGVEPGVLHVPSPSNWDSAVPAWLRGRREQVVGRLVEHSRHRVEPTESGYAAGFGREVRR